MKPLIKGDCDLYPASFWPVITVCVMEREEERVRERVRESE